MYNLLGDQCEQNRTRQRNNSSVSPRFQFQVAFRFLRRRFHSPPACTLLTDRQASLVERGDESNETSFLLQDGKDGKDGKLEESKREREREREKGNNKKATERYRVRYSRQGTSLSEFLIRGTGRYEKEIFKAYFDS